METKGEARRIRRSVAYRTMVTTKKEMDKVRSDGKMSSPGALQTIYLCSMLCLMVKPLPTSKRQDDYIVIIVKKDHHLGKLDVGRLSLDTALGII